jgi:hypothetical protein
LNVWTLCEASVEEDSQRYYRICIIVIWSNRNGKALDMPAELVNLPSPVKTVNDDGKDDGRAVQFPFVPLKLSVELANGRGGTIVGMADDAEMYRLLLELCTWLELLAPAVNPVLVGAKLFSVDELSMVVRFTVAKPIRLPNWT